MTIHNTVLFLKVFILTKLGEKHATFRGDTGLEVKFFSREPNCIFKSYLKVLCIEISTALGSLQKFEGAAGEFKGALGYRHPLILSPEIPYEDLRTIEIYTNEALHNFEGFEHPPPPPL